MKRKTNSTSIFPLLLLSFFLLIIPLIIIGIFFLSWSRNKMKETIEVSTKATLHYVTESFELKINDLTTHLNKLTNDDLFTNFVINQESFSTSEYYINLREQYELTASYPSIFPLVKDVMVHYPEYQFSMSAVTGLVAENNDYISTMLDASITPGPLIKMVDETLFLYDFYPASSMYTQSTPMFFLTLELEHASIVDFLDTFSQSYDSILYVNPQQACIYSSSIDDISKYTPYLNELIGINSKQLEENIFILSDSEYYMIAEYSPYLECTFVQFIPMREIFKAPDQISRFLLTYFLLTIPIILLFCTTVHRFIIRPINSLLEGYRQIEDENYAVILSENNSSLEFNSLVQGFNHMAAHLNTTINQLYTHKIYTQKMELKHLHMQMNPHFLYNTYFILHRLIKSENIEAATELSSYLGNFFQYITRSTKDMIALSEEWNHAITYSKIQEIRFSNRVKILYDVLPEKYENLFVPRLILQPLLENALEHGMRKVTANGIVSILFRDYTDYIELAVIDNGNQITQETAKELEASIHTPNSVGKEFTALHNIHRRLQLIYGNHSGLTIHLNEEGNLCVYLRIPTTLQTHTKGDTEHELM